MYVYVCIWVFALPLKYQSLLWSRHPLVPERFHRFIAWLFVAIFIYRCYSLSPQFDLGLVNAARYQTLIQWMPLKQNSLSTQTNNCQVGPIPPPLLMHNFCRLKFLFWQVCTNGAISLNKAHKAYTPKGFPLTSNDRAPLICPFWADTDIRKGGNVYSRITRDQTLLDRASLEGVLFTYYIIKQLKAETTLC